MFINKKCLWLICFRCFWYAILWCGKFPPIIRYSPGRYQRLIENWSWYSCAIAVSSFGVNCAIHST